MSTKAKTEQTPPKRKQRAKRLTSAANKGWQRKFIARLCKVPSISDACRVANVSRCTVYAKRKASESFRKAWDDALVVAVEGLEKAVWGRATEGVEEGVWRNGPDGQPICVERRRNFSDMLAIFLLKAHKPEKYREPRPDAAAVVTTTDGTRVEFNVGVSESELPG